MRATEMHRLAGAEPTICAELEAARIKNRQQLAPVGLDLQGRRATRPAPLWADTEIEPDGRAEPANGQTRSAAEVYHSADVQRAACWLRIRAALCEAAWWLAVPVATACAYALAKN
jgi:hypothetical protein